MRRRRGRFTAAASLAALVLGLIGTGAAFAQGQEIRTHVDGVQGYSLVATGSPSGVEFYEGFIPIPTDPGEPQFEITESHTRARLDVGPTGRAVASSLWPGAGAGGGFSQVCQCDGSYPIMAEARYPGETNRQSQTTPDGGGMTAAALGLDVMASAESSTSPGPELMDYGNVASNSESHVLDGQSISTVDASASDVSLLGGVITIDSVRTTLEAVSDTETATTGGTTEVNGLTILGQGYTVDEDGLHPVEQEQDGDGGDGDGDDGDGGDDDGGDPLGDAAGDVSESAPDAVAVLQDVLTSEELREEFGISARVVEHDEEISGSNGSRTAEGLRIIVETAPLRSALDPLPLAEVVGSVPNDDLKAQLFFLLQLSPRIDFVFGEGAVTAAATAPISIDPPSAPPPPATSGGSAAPPPSTGSTSGGTSPSVSAPSAPSSGGAEAPAVAPPSTTPSQQTVAAGAEMPPLWEGMPAAMLLFSLGLMGIGGYGLLGLTQSAMTATAGGAAGEPCALTDTSLHDLRR